MSGEATFFELSGRPAVRFVRDYATDASQLWSAVSEPEGLARWFPAPQVSFEPQSGAVMTFEGDANEPESSYFGRVLVYEPGSSLRFDWGGDELWFDVVPVGDAARFTLTNLLAERNAAARNAAGWQVCLRALDERFGVESPAGGPDWRRWYRRYVRRGFPEGAFIPAAD